jgi:hypothetical protein
MLRAGVIIVWTVVRVLPAPPRSPAQTGISRFSAARTPLSAAPWSVEDIGTAFVVKDGSGQQLAYVHYEEEPGRRSAAKLLSKDEARNELC